MTDGPATAGFTSAWSRSADGFRLHARVYGDGASGRMPVVGLPGLTRNASEFHHLALALLDLDAADRVIAVDYRGRGLSDHDPDPSHYTVPVETADLLALLTDLGVTHAVFAGVSRGGLIAMGLGAMRPDLVRGIVLNDIGPVVERAGLMRIKGYVGTFGAPPDYGAGAAHLRSTFGAQFPNLTPAEWEDWARTVWTGEPGHLALAYDTALARTLDGVTADAPIPDLWPLFDKLAGIPMLVVRGGLSDLLSAETVAEMARRHPGLEAIEADDEGHTPFLHRPAIAQRMAAFVGRSGEAR